MVLVLASSAAGSSGKTPRVPVWGAPVLSGALSDGHDNELQTVDLNGDGLRDVIVGDQMFDRIQPLPPVFLLSRGGGRFVDATAALFDGSPPAAQWNRQMVIADFNGDHRPDVFIADIGTDNTAINPGFPGQQNELILSEPNGKFRDATANLPQRFTFSHSAAAADVNGDGTIDIFENNIGGLGRSHAQADILLNDGSGHFTVATDRLRGFPRDVYGNTHSLACAFADVNGDGHPDLILGGSDAVDRSAVLLNDGHGSFDFFEWLPPKLYAANALVISIATSDVNGDGATDLLLAETQQDPYYIGSKIQVLINDGHGQFSDETSTRLLNQPTGQSWPERLLLEDLNDDGKPDIFLQYAPPGIVPQADPTPVWLNENGVFTRIQGPAQGSAPGSRGMVGFVNGDGPHAFFSLGSTRDGQPASYYVTPQIVAPTTAPSQVRTQPVPGGIRISWRPVNGATEYEIWRGRPKKLVTSTVRTTYLDTRTRPGKVAVYSVRARNQAGPGPFSPSVTAKRPK
ncbi:MAG TPA: FG-GAP-like repeat-containing protein [Gaiellaceae bacterium]|nr:FG-GAP-like repeat-containing protein [Gaiellaceae bacterium]